MNDPKKPSAEISSKISSNFIEVEGLKLHYLESGKGEAVLMLHGFPTSAYLWRNIIPKLAETHRVIAMDLPAFGKSDKPLSVSYSFNFYNKILNGILEKLSISKFNLIVHDLGGPIGLSFAVKHPDRIKRLILLNTLVYPDFSWGVKLFGLVVRLPMIKDWVASPSGIRFAMRLGVQNKDRIKGDLLKNYQTPFSSKNDRQTLLKSAVNLSVKAFKEIEEKLPLFNIPVRIIYGEDDRILPKVASTMQRVKNDLPQTEITAISNCGHFLQEDEPEMISDLLSDFLNK